MLPLLRTTLLGGALAAAAFLAGFAIPDATRPHLAQFQGPARGPLQDAATHPEWKQMLVQAAIQRAQEIDRLRELPGHSAPPGQAVATLPQNQRDTDPDDSTASVTDAPETVLQVEIGEASSTELPVGTPAILPTPPERPQTLRPTDRTEVKPVRKRRKARLKTPKPEKPAEAATNPFAALFGSSSPTQNTQKQ
ncbi:MAG: hypothetical protein JO254_11165 [Pseudolabrys sp.]|nr:hypothetical protein [Pseudolabrys sp.]